MTTNENIPLANDPAALEQMRSPFENLGDEAREAADVGLTKAEGDAQTRAIVYHSIISNTLLEAMNSERITASDSQIVTATWSLMRDRDAWKVLEDEGIYVPTPSELGMALYTAGYRDKAILVHQGWNYGEGIQNEELFDQALITIASAGVGAGYNAARYGTVRGLRALPAIAQWRATENVTYQAPGVVRLVNGAVKAGMTRTEAALAAGRALMYGKMPTSAVPYAYGIERMVRNTSMRKAFRWAVAGNFFVGAVNLGLQAADNMAHPDEWDEADRAAFETMLEQTGQDVDPDTAAAAQALGITILGSEGNMAMATTDEQGFLGAQPQGLTEQPGGRLGESGTSLIDIMGQANTSRFEGAAQLRMGDDLVVDPSGNVVSIDLSTVPEDLTPAEQAAWLNARLEVAAQPTADEDPLIGIPTAYDELGSGEGYWAQQGSNVVRYDETMDAVAAGELTPDQGRGRVRSMAIHGGPGTPVAVQAEYRGSMARDTIYNMTAAQLERFQDMAIRAGLINRADPAFVFGSRDQQTMDAMMTVMGHANNTGRSWRGQLSAMGSAYQSYLREEEEKKKKDEPPKPLFVPSAPYSPLDPETIGQGVEDLIEKRLGRSANDFEIAEFAGYLEGNHRVNYDNQIAAERAIWEARGRANLGEDPGALPQLEMIDEDARFEAKFEDRYDEELREVDRWDRMKQDTNTLFRSFDTVTAAMGGSR